MFHGAVRFGAGSEIRPTAYELSRFVPLLFVLDTGIDPGSEEGFHPKR
jgi:hypothetical protein